MTEDQLFFKNKSTKKNRNKSELSDSDNDLLLRKELFRMEKSYYRAKKRFFVDKYNKEDWV